LGSEIKNQFLKTKFFSAMETEIYQATENTNSAANTETEFHTFESNDDFFTDRDFGDEDAHDLFEV
jgi:hypothetical protein